MTTKNDMLAAGYNIAPGLLSRKESVPLFGGCSVNVGDYTTNHVTREPSARHSDTDKVAEAPQTKLQKDLAKVFLDLREVVSVFGKIFAGLIIAAMAVAVAVACVTKNGNRRRRLRHPWTC